MMRFMLLVHGHLYELRCLWIGRLTLLTCLCLSTSNASGVDRDLNDEAVRFTGHAGGFLYVANQGWNESPWLGSYVITIYRAGEVPLFTDGTVAKRDGQLMAVLTADLDGDGQPELILCFSEGQRRFGAVHIYRIHPDGSLTRTWQDRFDWHADIPEYGARDRFFIRDGSLYRKFEWLENTEPGLRQYRLNYPDGAWEPVKE